MQWCPLWYLLYLVSVFCGGVHDVGHGDVHGAGRDGETLLPRRQRLQPPFPMPGQAPFQSWESVKMEVWKWKFPKIEIIFILITRFSWQRCCLQCLELGFSYLSFCKTSKYLWYRLHNTRHQTSEEEKRKYIDSETIYKCRWWTLLSGYKQGPRLLRPLKKKLKCFVCRSIWYFWRGEVDNILREV